MAFARKTIQIVIALAVGEFGSGYNQITIQGLPVSVELGGTGDGGRAVADVVIDGLKLSLMEQLTTLAFAPQARLKNFITINVGDEGAQLVTVFTGDIDTAFADFLSAPAISFRIHALSGQYAALMATPPITVDGAMQVADLMKQFATEAGAGFVNHGVNMLVRNCVFVGSPYQKAEQLARQQGLNFYVGNDGNFHVGYMLAPSDVNAVVLNRNTGLLGYPTFSSDGIELNAIYDPNFAVQNPIVVESVVPKASGKWYITKVTSHLEAYKASSGQWTSSISATTAQHFAEMQQKEEQSRAKGGSGVTGAVGNANLPIDQGMAEGEKQWLGATMDNHSEGCAEAAGKVGSYYSPFLKQECQNGVVGVPQMVSDAGNQVIPFDASQLQKGDCIVYGDDDHVVIYDGNGGYIGNSSSQDMVVHGTNYNEMGGLTPTKIIKTSQF